MNPPTAELFRALLRRALGARLVAPTLVLALVTGVVTGWVAGRCLAAGIGTRPSAGLLAWLLVNFDRTALYGLGMLGALQLAVALGNDVRGGWTIQYFAAGATRDRYILALAAAEACACALLYLLAAGAWLVAATAVGRPISHLAGTTALFPAALLWLSTPAAFAAAAVAVTGSAGRAIALMACVVVAPWLALAALQPDPALGAPAWLPWSTAASPPYPVTAGLPALCLSGAYTALLLGIAWVAAPKRLLLV